MTFGQAPGLAAAPQLILTIGPSITMPDGDNETTLPPTCNSTLLLLAMITEPSPVRVMLLDASRLRFFEMPKLTSPW